MKRYNVYIGWRNSSPIGVITGTSFTHASTKAQQLYGRHAWVEPKEQLAPVSA